MDTGIEMIPKTENVQTCGTTIAKPKQHIPGKHFMCRLLRVFIS
jgi:hypothetical protein